MRLVVQDLLVRDDATRRVIGTYRVLTPAQARRVGSTYSDTEFDLTRLRDLPLMARRRPATRNECAGSRF